MSPVSKAPLLLVDSRAYLSFSALACDVVGVSDSIDVHRLMSIQDPITGGWEDCGWIYSYGRADIHLGNVGLTTALAIQAIETLDQRDKFYESKL